VVFSPLFKAMRDCACTPALLKKSTEQKQTMHIGN
jgi:hypothetical protein